MSDVVAILELESDLSSSLTELDSAFNENLETIDCEFADGIDLGGTRDYNKLIHKPSINGTELVGNYDEIDPTVPQYVKDGHAVDGRSPIVQNDIYRMFHDIFGI